MTIGSKNEKQGETDLPALTACLWLRQSVYNRIPWDKKKRLCIVAEQYGRTVAEQFPVDTEENIFLQLEKYGVSLKKFMRLNLSDCREKAYYIPEEKRIYYDDGFAKALWEQESSPLLGGAEQIEKAVLLHEFFHHLEEYFVLSADCYLRKKGERYATKICRELAAFGFVNRQFAGYECQWIDIFWMKACAAEQYQALCRTCRDLQVDFFAAGVEKSQNQGEEHYGTSS